MFTPCFVLWRRCPLEYCEKRYPDVCSGRPIEGNRANSLFWTMFALFPTAIHFMCQTQKHGENTHKLNWPTRGTAAPPQIFQEKNYAGEKKKTCKEVLYLWLLTLHHRHDILWLCISWELQGRTDWHFRQCQSKYNPQLWFILGLRHIYKTIPECNFDISDLGLDFVL